MDPLIRASTSVGPEIYIEHVFQIFLRLRVNHWLSIKMYFVSLRLTAVDDDDAFRIGLITRKLRSN